MSRKVEWETCAEQPALTFAQTLQGPCPICKGAEQPKPEPCRNCPPGVVCKTTECTRLSEPKLEPVAGAVLMDNGVSLVKIGDEDHWCRTRRARRLFAAPPAIPEGYALAMIRVTDFVRGWRSGLTSAQEAMIGIAQAIAARQESQPGAPAPSHEGTTPPCPKCGNNRQVWRDPIKGVMRCHRAYCDMEVSEPREPGPTPFGGRRTDRSRA